MKELFAFARVRLAAAPAAFDAKEIYNLFNHAQFYSVDGNSGNQGTTFGQPQKVRDPRLLQLALKLPL